MAGNILIAVPAFGGQIHYRCAESLRLLDSQLVDLGIAHTFRYIANESLITRARNWFANLALFGADEEGAAFSHLLFVDADLAFNAQDIVAMVRADKSIVALPYALKAIDWQNVVNAVKSGATAEQLPHLLCNPVIAMHGGPFNPNEITPVRSAGTGLMLIQTIV